MDRLLLAVCHRCGSLVLPANWQDHALDHSRLGDSCTVAETVVVIGEVKPRQ